MRHKISILALFSSLFVFFQATAQIPENIRPKLQGLLPMEVFHDQEVYFGSADLKPGVVTDIPVIIEVTSPAIFSEIETLGGRVNTREGNLATVQLPKKSLAGVAALPGVISLEYNKVFRQNNIARQHVRADWVQQGLNPLPQGFTGEGIIVGVSDAGIDFRHPDFRDPVDPSKSRILAIWDQLSSVGTPPNGFSYGSFWTRPQIEAELGPNSPGIVDAKDDDPGNPGHGTHVTGIAAGNRGMAPRAGIVLVRDNATFNGIIDAVKFIRDFANDVDKPAVVNLSTGTHASNHEGNTNMSKLIDNLLAGTEQFSVVASAGNTGFENSHWGGFNLNNDTAICFIGFGGQTYGWFRVPKTYGDSLYFSVGVDSAHFDISQFQFTGGTQYLGATPWTKVSTLTNFSQFIKRPSGDTAAYVELIYQSNAGLQYYPFFVRITDMANPQDWYKTPEDMDVFRVMFRGKGNFHGWMGGGPFWPVPNPDDLGLPTEHFVPSDSDLGILSPADGKNIIAVGAYVNRPDWTNVSGNTHHFFAEQQTGELADFSSHGPTFDGRQKPEICAPGKHVISAYPTYYNELAVPLPFFSGGDPLWMFVDDTIHACYSGTSMSSPVVAGCIALLLEAKPDLNYTEIRDLLTSTALTDAFTDASGPLPNGLFGYGKIDIFSAVLAALGLSETENISPENPFAVFPNPATDMFFLKLTDENPRPEARLRLLNAQGKVVFEKTGVSNFETVRTAGFVPGVYFLEMTDGGRKMVDKILVMK
jgi:subtilisin family serine protease